MRAYGDVMFSLLLVILLCRKVDKVEYVHLTRPGR